MKAILQSEIFASTKLDDIEILVEKPLKNVASKLTKEELKGIISKYPFVQKALIEELVYMDSLKDEFDLISLNHNFFIGELYTSDEMAFVVQSVYEKVMPIMGKNQGLVGFAVSRAFNLALEAVRELYDENKIDDFVTHFLSLTEQVCLDQGEHNLWMAEKRTAPTKYDWDESFYKIIDSDLKQIGIYAFYTNKFNEEALERDYYIQKFIELGKRVYICQFAGEKLLTVYIK